MLIDGRRLDLGSTLRTEFCVVGTGMGGGAVAQRLAAAGRDVLLIEAGGLRPRTDESVPVATEHVGRPFGLPVTRGIELGGSSGLWHGICTPLDEVDFEVRPWVQDSGWPFNRAALDPYYTQATGVLGIADARHFDAQSTDPCFRDRLRDIEFDRTVLEEKLLQHREPPHRWGATLLQMARADRLGCLIHAPALELVVHDSGRVVEGLLVGARGGAGTATVTANVFVVCAGALETPRLLLNSRRLSPAGVGNQHDLVGRYLLDHPIGHYCKIGFRKPTRAPLYASQHLEGAVHLLAGIRVKAEQQQRHRLPNHCMWLRPSISAARINDELLLSFLGVRSAWDLSLHQVIGMLTHRDLLYRVLVHRFGFHPRYHYGDLFYMTEQLPNPDSRVQLSDRVRDCHGYPVARIDWRLTNNDFDSYAAYAQLVLKQGMRSESYSIAREDPIEIWARTTTSGAHHLGTARMADDPARGVVDPNLQVFGMANLFICDGSVFPTAGCANPSFTIVALGLRLAEHLLSRDCWSA